jgi:hypothetical protein
MLQGIDLQGIYIVVIGYQSCPFSLKALDFISQSETYREHFKFISFGSHNKEPYFHTVGNFKTTFHYSGTFPLIFVRFSDGFHYIGGFSDLEALNKH